MGWEDRGRQEHGWFGNGTTAEDKQIGAAGAGGAPGGLVDRVQVVVPGAAAALPRELRYHSVARPDAKTLDQLTMAMTAWARGAGTDVASFAKRFFGRAGDDPIVGKLWASATMADRARSHADLGAAATDLADARQLVGLDRWPRFLADAEWRVAERSLVTTFETFGSRPSPPALRCLPARMASPAAMQCLPVVRKKPRQVPPYEA
jgi:hypothetical protein